MPWTEISTLPDDILCRILSLVPTKTATKTSVLSKRWGRVWTFVPRFEAQSLYQNKTFFSRFMDNYFQARRETSHTIASFDLCTTYHGAKSCVDFWLSAAVSSRVEEFKLRFLSAAVNRKKVHIYSFPRTFLLRMSSLRFLALEGIRWLKNGASPFDFPSLKVLSLEKIYGLADEQLTALLSGSPSLEDLLLKNCVDLRNPKIKSSSLKTVKVVPENCSCVTKTVQLEAKKVESLVYNRGHSHETCGLVLVSCESMKSLLLSNASFGDSLLRGLVSALPFLEEVVLDSCKELRDIRIESVSLVRLVVKNIGFCLEKKAAIVAPKLAFFSFCNESVTSLSLNGPTFLAVDIKIFAWRTYHYNYTREWYVNLINFLKNLDSCKGVSVWVSVEKALIIPTELRTECFPPLPTLKHLKVTTEYPLYRKRIFRASLRWISPSVETLIVEEKAKFS